MAENNDKNPEKLLADALTKVKELEASIAKRDGKITKLTDDVADALSKVKELEASIAERDDSIKELMNENDLAKQIDDGVVGSLVKVGNDVYSIAIPSFYFPVEGKMEHVTAERLLGDKKLCKDLLKSGHGCLVLKEEIK